jgi:ABC-type nitrate/sulfonate/bicarbonate transport system permease component
LASGSAVVTCGILAFWAYLSASGTVPALFLPAPSAAFSAFADGIASGEGVAAAAITVCRMLAGWVSAAALGIVLGGIVASSRLLSDLLVPTLEFFRQIPSSAKLPIVILFMGLTNEMIVVAIALGALWPVMLATIQGFRSVEPALIEIARILQMGSVATFAKIRRRSSSAWSRPCARGIGTRLPRPGARSSNAGKRSHGSMAYRRMR